MKKFKIDKKQLERNWDNAPELLQAAVLFGTIGLAVLYLVFFICTIYLVITKEEISVLSLEITISWIPFYCTLLWSIHRLFNNVFKMETIEKSENTSNKKLDN